VRIDEALQLAVKTSAVKLIAACFEDRRDLSVSHIAPQKLLFAI
jgi:hypothetical protein